MAPPLHATGKTGSQDEPGTSPFILAKLQQTCQVAERFMFMTPTSPCLALSSSSSSNSHLPSKAPMSLRSLERTHHQRTSQERRCSLPSLSITLSLPCHQLSNEKEVSCHAVTDTWMCPAITQLNACFLTY